MSAQLPVVVMPHEGYHPGFVAELLPLLPKVKLLAPSVETEEEFLRECGQADIIVPMGPLMRSFLNSRTLPQLRTVRAIITSGAGFDGVDVATATQCGIPVAATADFCGVELAEHALALLLAAARKICPVDAALRDPHREDAFWSIHKKIGLLKDPLYRLADKVAGIVGFGRSGQLLARRLQALDMQVIAYDHHAAAKVETFAGWQVESVTLQELLRRSDVVSLHIPLNKGTHHLIGERELGLMKRTAILVNISRGALVDEAALALALRERRIMAAGLDVYEQEPFTPENPLAQLDNVVLSAHLAAVTVETTADRLTEIAANIGRVAAGKRPANLVNPECYSRSPR